MSFLVVNCDLSVKKRHRSGGEFTVTGGYGANTGGKRRFTSERVTEIKTRTVKERR